MARRWFSFIRPARLKGEGGGRAIALGLGGAARGELIIGDGNNNYIVGTDYDDTILAAGGRDTILGGEGNDAIDGGPSNDTIYGGGGNDSITVGGGFSHEAWGGDGDDTIGMGSAGGMAHTGAGSNLILVTLPNVAPQDIRMAGSADELRITGFAGSTASDVAVSFYTHGTDLVTIDGEAVNFAALPPSLYFEIDGDDILLKGTGSAAVIRFVGLAIQFHGYSLKYDQNYGGNIGW